MKLKRAVIYYECSLMVRNKAWVRSRLYYKEFVRKLDFYSKRVVLFLEYRYCLHSVFKQIKFKAE